MNRRGFLGMLGALVTAPFVPNSAQPFSGIDWASGPEFVGYYDVSTMTWNVEPALWPITDELLEDARALNVADVARWYHVPEELIR